MARCTIALLLLFAIGLCTDARALTALEQRGRVLVGKFCAQCHAVGRSGKSTYVAAPPFRQLDRRLDIDAFLGQLQEGFASGHPDMPMFRFSRADAQAVVAYLRAVQGK
jgi:mono/diheme cytochrome c family protein